MPTDARTLTSIEPLLSSTSRTSEDIATLVRVGSLLNSTLNLSKVLETAMTEAARIMDAEASSVLLVDEATGDLTFEVATGEKGQDTREIRLRRGEGIAGWVAAHGRPVRVDDVQADPRFAARVDKKTTFVTRSVLCVPLQVKDRTLGVLEVINRRGGRLFSEQDEEFLVLLAHQIAAAVDNAQLYRRVHGERETLRAVLGGMADGVLVVDPEDRILLSNPAVRAWVGGADDGPDLEDFGDDRMTGLVSRLEAWARDSLSFEIVVAGGDDARTLSNTATALRDPDGRTTGAVVVLRDETEKARLEKMRNDFIATTSHKLRTPLTAILGFSSLLKTLPGNRAADPDEDPVAEAAEAIEAQGRVLQGLIEKLLEFTGMEPGALRLDKQRVDLREVAGDAVRAVGPRARQAEIEMRIDAEAPVYVLADRHLLTRVAANLLENAVKFSPAGTRVSIRVDGGDGAGRLHVCDQGPGIPPEERERIFEKFYQIDRDLTGQVEGAGLGLALCRNVVDAHGGRIDLAPGGDRGSTFTVYVPIE